MSVLIFKENDRAYFPTKHHKKVSLSKAKWLEITQEPERFYYRENGDKIATTLINPDLVRHHNHVASQFIYYKEFNAFTIGNREVTLRVNFWAVIIDIKTKRICTVYPLLKPKPGREFKKK